MMSCLYVLVACCLAAVIFLFVGGCDVIKDYEKKFTELETKASEHELDIKILQKSCEEVKTTIENLCNSFNSMLEHNNDLCLDMDEYDRQLEQMGEALEKHISDRVVWHELEELKKRVDKLTAVELKTSGYSNAAIGEQLGIAESSVRKLLEGVVQTLGVDCTIDDTNYDEEDVYHE